VGINVLGVIGTLDKYIEKKIITGEWAIIKSIEPEGKKADPDQIDRIW
jgi:hypothetical protein